MECTVNVGINFKFHAIKKDFTFYLVIYRCYNDTKSQGFSEYILINMGTTFIKFIIIYGMIFIISDLINLSVN